MSSPFLESVHTDPWADEFLDLPGLNARASDAIEANVGKTRTVARSEPRSLRSSSLVVLGPPGAGKTHLFGRLRCRLGPRAVFVHVRPLVHAPMTPRFLLAEVVKQLGYATQGQVQLHALVGSLLAHLCGASATFPSAFLSEYALLSDAERGERLDAAVEQVLGIWQEIDDTYLRRLLQAPFESGGAQRAILAWLSGRDCDPSQLTRIGASASLSEELAMPALRTLCSVAALGAPIVLVFDQLENLIDGSEPGARLLGYANLAAELVDSMRGLVLVHMALDTEWTRAIEPALNLSQRSRLLMQRETLSLPSAREREELLRLWIDAVPEKKAPFPWPFSDARLAALMRAPGITPRMLMVECRQALDGNESADSEAAEAGSEVAATGLMEEWERRLTAARQVITEADEERACVGSARLADGLLAVSAMVDGVRLSSSNAGNPVHLALEAGGKRREVAILDHGNYKSLGSAFKKLTTLTGKAPVTVIRERSRDLPPTWKDTLAKRAALLATGQAEWLWLGSDDVARLLALDALLQGARSGDVTNERGQPVDVSTVSEWIRESLEIPAWEIVRQLRGQDEAESVEPEKAPATPAPPVPSSGGVAFTVLRQLGLASLERVVRESTRLEPTSTRALVVAELEARSDVKFFGRAIVCVRVSS